MNRSHQISQETFDAAVQENVEEFGMDLEEAIEDAVQSFKIQGVDLTGIITKPNSEGVREEIRVVAVSKLLSAAVSELGSSALEEDITSNVETLIQIIKSGTEIEKKEAIVLAGRNNVVESCIQMLSFTGQVGLESTLELLDLLLVEDEIKQIFWKSEGPKPVSRILISENKEELESDGSARLVQMACQVLATSSERFELTKESFIDLGAVDWLVSLTQLYMAYPKTVIATANAMMALGTNDDGRVIASKAFSNARTLADSGAVQIILEAAKVHNSDSSALSSLCLALKAISVNDEICERVCENGGIALVLEFVQNATSKRDSAMAKSAISLLSQLAGNDSNKQSIVSLNGLPALLQSAVHFSSSPSVPQEVFGAVAVLCLRQPGIADVSLRLGFVDVACEMMSAHESASLLQRSACMMIRNMAVRNPENRQLILEKGVEPLLRTVKKEHKQYKDVAAAALRDLGFDDYNY